MKKIIFLYICFASSFFFSQQIPQYSQWFWNLFAINPAYAGLKPCLEVKTIYRTQYANLEGSPNSGVVTFSAPIYTRKRGILTPRQGCGFKFEADKIGPFTMNRFNLSYAGHFNFTKDTRLSIGISAGFKQWIYDKEKSTTLVPDPVLQESNSYFSPDASLGLWWNGENYFISASFNELARSNWNNIGMDSRFGMHTFLKAGYRLPINDQFTFLPFLITRIPPKGPVSADLNLVFDYKNKIGFGAGLRNGDAVNFLLLLKFKENFNIGYSFDYVISSLGRNEFFTHEFSLTYGSCKNKSTSKTICPLF
jgi:type IX secretion system PorP/SprF family membrane protein